MRAIGSTGGPPAQIPQKRERSESTADEHRSRPNFVTQAGAEGDQSASSSRNALSSTNTQESAVGLHPAVASGGSTMRSILNSRHADTASSVDSLPPGFASYGTPEGDMPPQHGAALLQLTRGPSFAMLGRIRRRISHDLNQEMLSRLDPGSSRLWQHQAGIDEWKTIVDVQLNALKKARAIGANTLDAAQERMADQYGSNTRYGLTGNSLNLELVALRSLVVQDLLTVTANERAMFESSGVSRMFDSGALAEAGDNPAKQVPLNLKRFTSTSELILHAQTIHTRVAAESERGEVPNPVLSQATFMLNSKVHVASANMLTAMHEGKPKTVLFCVEGSTAARTACELKQVLDMEKNDDVTALVINAHTQVTTVDCPTFALFHAEKYRQMIAAPGFMQMLHDVLDGKVNAMTYALPWGNKEGAKVYFIEDDSDPRSQILPASILKEMQNREALQKTEEKRGWQQTRLVKKGQMTLLERHDASYPNEARTPGKSTLMIDKQIKYLERAKEGLRNLENFYGKEQAEKMLNQLLDEVRRPGTDASPALDEQGINAIRQAQLDACDVTIRLFQAREAESAEVKEMRHQAYLIGLAQSGNYPEDISDDDYDAVEDYREMSEEELASISMKVNSVLRLADTTLLQQAESAEVKEMRHQAYLIGLAQSGNYPEDISDDDHDAVESYREMSEDELASIAMKVNSVLHLAETALHQQFGSPDDFFEQCAQRGMTLESEMQRRTKLSAMLVQANASD